MSDSEDSQAREPAVGFGPVVESLEKSVRNDIYEIPKADKIIVVRNPLYVNYSSLNKGVLEKEANDILTSKNP